MGAGTLDFPRFQVLRLHNWFSRTLFKILFLPPANEVLGKVIFLHLSVILFMGGGACPRSACPGWGACPGGACQGDQVHPLGRHPPRTRYTPQNQVPTWYQVHSPRTRYTPQDQVHPPSGAVHAGRYGQQAGGMHPTGMHSCSKKFYLPLLSIYFYHPPPKIREGNVFTHVCLSVHTEGPHVTISHYALDLTVQGPLPAPWTSDMIHPFPHQPQR